MQAPSRGMRQRWASLSSKRSLEKDEVQGSFEIHGALWDDPGMQDDAMEDEDWDLTMGGDLEIDVPHASWPKSSQSSSTPRAAVENLEWLDRFAREQAQRSIRQSLKDLKQPWEQGIMAGVFDKKQAWAFPRSSMAMPRVGVVEAFAATTHVVAEPALPSSSSAFAHQRVRSMRLHRTDDDVRRKSLDRITTLMLLDSNAARVGRSLISFAGTLVTDVEIANSITDVFGPKSNGAILKRTNAIWRYVCFLKESQAGPTTASHFLEALHFFNGLLGFEMVHINDIMSTRVKGSAHTQFVKKRIRKPAELLMQSEVQELENIVLTSDAPHFVVLAGHFLFCIFAAARWYDAMNIERSHVSTYRGVWLIEAETRKHKTSTTKQVQTELLPFTALGRAFSVQPWVERWMSVREDMGLNDKKQFLPSWSETKLSWTSHSMTSAEASSWLRELLAPTSGYDRAAKLTIHGLKATLISWAAKSLTFTPEELTALGHHVSKAHRSAMIYPRDNQIALSVKVRNMLVRMRAGQFNPDQPRAARLLELVAAVAQEGHDPVEASSSDSGADDSDDTSIESSGAEPDNASHLPRANPMEVDPSMCVVHCRSSIIHVRKPAPSNSMVSCNFRAAKPTDLQNSKSLVCAGCSRQLQRWRDSA
eukprot:Skav203545  [mRNA]  locus=scaffold220:180774:182793:+ [translate_table: standard]